MAIAISRRARPRGLYHNAVLCLRSRYFPFPGYTYIFAPRLPSRWISPRVHQPATLFINARVNIFVETFRNKSVHLWIYCFRVYVKNGFGWKSLSRYIASQNFYVVSSITSGIKERNTYGDNGGFIDPTILRILYLQPLIKCWFYVHTITLGVMRFEKRNCVTSVQFIVMVSCLLVHVIISYDRTVNSFIALKISFGQLKEIFNKTNFTSLRYVTSQLKQSIGHFIKES